MGVNSRRIPTLMFEIVRVSTLIFYNVNENVLKKNVAF